MRKIAAVTDGEAAVRPEDMREAMASYVRTVHEAYWTQAQLQTPAVRARMPIASGAPLNVVAAGAHNLHVFATHEELPPPQGPEVVLEDVVGPIAWSLRFYDPVVLPTLGMIDERSGPASSDVRQAVGVTTHLYHLIVQPGSGLTPHQAGHAGAGLANSHIAEARDFQAIRAHASGAATLVDEMEGAALAGLQVAQRLLAQQIAPWSEEVKQLPPSASAEEVRRTLLTALRGAGDG